MKSELFERIVEETRKIETAAKAWNELFAALDDYAILLEDILFSRNSQKTIRESLEKDKFQYCIGRIDENIDIIIRCLRFDPLIQVSPTFFQKIVTLFSRKMKAEKKDLDEMLSTQKLIKFSGKIENIIYYFNNLDKSESQYLLTYREELHDSLEKFQAYLLAYNKLSPKKEVVGLLEAIKKWRKVSAEEQEKVIDNWERREIPDWKSSNY